MLLGGRVRTSKAFANFSQGRLDGEQAAPCLGRLRVSLEAIDSLLRIGRVDVELGVVDLSEEGQPIDGGGRRRRGEKQVAELLRVRSPPSVTHKTARGS